MITRRLICVLNEGDILDRGRKLANAELHYRGAEAEKKSKMEEFKQTLDAINTRMIELSDAVRDGKEVRDVEVLWQANHGRLTKELIRLDTSEIVETVPMSNEERQGTLI